MIFTSTTLNDAWIIDLEKRGDERGFFARSMCKSEFDTHGLLSTFVQQNTSVSADKGTVRGMHFQHGDAVEAKLVRCVKGAIVDIIVDLRSDSPSFMQHQAFELSATNYRQLYVPPGFAHSFQSITDDVEVSYLVSAPYTPAAEFGLRYSDPRLGIAWPLPVSSISAKDAVWPLLETDSPAFF